MTTPADLRSRAEQPYHVTSTRRTWFLKAHPQEVIEAYSEDGSLHESLALEVESLEAHVQRLEAEQAKAIKQRDNARADALYHADCRPNRQQAEAWRDDAKAMNDKWADEVKARRDAEASLTDLRSRLLGIVEQMRTTVIAENGSHRRMNAHECADYVAALLDLSVSSEGPK